MKRQKAMSSSENPRRVLIVSSIFHPHVFGGAEVAAYNRARLLVRRGCDVSVVTLREQNSPPAWGEVAPEGYRLYRVASPRRQTLFDRHRTLPKKGGILWHLQDYFDVRNHHLLGAIMDEVVPDHVEIDNLIGLGFNVLTEIGRRKIPTVYILHDLHLACLKTGMFRKGKSCARQCLRCRPAAILRQATLGGATHLGFISPSQANLEKAKKFVPVVNRSLSCVIRNVPEHVPELPQRVKSDRIRLTYAGRLDPVKGISFLLRVLDRLSPDYDFHLTVLGTGPDEESLRAEYGQKSWVTFRGFVPKQQVMSVLAASDLLCMPSLVQESYGLVTAEALQLGTPVIGSDAGGTAELVRPGVTGMLVAAGDEKAWQKALGEIFDDPGRLETWHENVVRYAHEFGEDSIWQAYESFLAKLSGQKVLEA